MSQHLRIGVKDGVSETIRVHFAWDEPTRMIVIGSRRRSPVGKLIMGSTAQRIIIRATLQTT